MDAAALAPLRRELAEWRAEGRRLEVWIRDDDVVAPAAALDRLIDLAARFDAPIALAVIPAAAEPALAERLRDAPGARALPHGWAHANHAPASAKKTEFGDDRPLTARRQEAAAGWARLQSLFGAAATPIFTPPWNRAAPDFVRAAPSIGFAALSRFGPRAAAEAAPGLTALNAHLDPIDWRGRRSLRAPEALAAAAAAHLAARRAGDADDGEPFGLLTHCLQHDAAIWSFCERVLALFADFAETAHFIDIGSHIDPPR